MDAGRAEALWRLLMHPEEALPEEVGAVFLNGSITAAAGNAQVGGIAATYAQRSRQATEAAMAGLPAPAV